MTRNSATNKVRVERCRGCGVPFEHHLIYVHLRDGCWKEYRAADDGLWIGPTWFVRGGFHVHNSTVMGIATTGKIGPALTGQCAFQAREIAKALNWSNSQRVQTLKEDEAA